jgi:acyl dehydratase
VLFTSITMNPAWVHLDFDYAEHETEFGKPIVNSLLTLGMVVGVSVHETTLGTTVLSRPGQGIVVFEYRAFNQHDVLCCKAPPSALMLFEPTD